jgi:hypothetical protein
MEEKVEIIHFEKTDGEKTCHCIVKVFGDGSACVREDDGSYTIIEHVDDSRGQAIATAESLGYRLSGAPENSS